jgi:arabinan endo-1,5-alpha-L-arabinosidase
MSRILSEREGGAVRWLAALVLCLLLPSAAMGQETQPQLTGHTFLHDPSVIEVEGRYVAFSTGEEVGAHGGAIRLKTSPDGLVWKDAGAIGKGIPAWVRDTLGFQPRNIWAPNVSKHGDTWYLYYSVSTFGVNTSAIGLMTHKALDPEAPGEGWEDQGLVLRSDRSDNFNAIDPARIDTSDGRAFLAFGSFWSGIKMRELDRVSGKLIAEDTPVVDLASRGGGAIEAPSILEHEGRFYLFVSFDRCCIGLSSTYNIRVGRADEVTGPYVDEAGIRMLFGGGTLLLGKTGRYIGPGAQEAIVTSKGEMLVYHYYDQRASGAAKLQITPLRWTADGWPELDALPD